MDYVLPFVNCEDPVWTDQYRQTCGKGMDESRFRPFGTLKYAFRSVAKNLPFVDRIVLIVSTRSQVPDWINLDKVKIVTHDEFIPEKFLPTFNSSTIETYMWKIKGLSELFLYGNDDFFVLKPLTEDDFFLESLPRLDFEISDYKVRNMFRTCCRNGMDMAADAAGTARSGSRVLLKPQHCIKGINDRQMKEVGCKIADRIGDTVSPLRHWDNITGYVYHYYAYYTGKYATFNRTYTYIRIDNDYEKVLRLIANPETDMLCINDAGDLESGHYEAACKALTECFERLFPERSIYEG